MQLLSLALLAPAIILGQFPPIGNIEIYGLRNAAMQDVQKAIGLNEGDPVPVSDSEAEAVQRRVERVAGVVRARVSMGCCTAGKSSIFVGIEEKGATRIEFRPAPHGDVKLPNDLFGTYQRMMTAWEEAIKKGDNEDNMESGHSLMKNSAVRAFQERFVVQAQEHLGRLRAVLRDSSDAEQRAAAAWIIGYAPDKRAVLDDLLHAVRDPDDTVRNNAIRALAAITVLAKRKPELGIRISPAPFISLLNSITLSDRNKALAILVSLTANRPPDVLDEIREKALPSLVEMVRWKEYDRFAYTLLGRMAGMTDDEIETLATPRQREELIARVTQRKPERR